MSEPRLLHLDMTLNEVLEVEKISACALVSHTLLLATFRSAKLDDFHHLDFLLFVKLEIIAQ